MSGTKVCPERSIKDIHRTIVIDTLLRLLIQSPYSKNLFHNIRKLPSLQNASDEIRQKILSVVDSTDCVNNPLSSDTARLEALDELEPLQQTDITPIEEKGVGSIQSRLKSLVNAKFEEFNPNLITLIVDLLLTSLNENKGIGERMTLSEDQTKTFYHCTGIPINIKSITAFHCLCIAATSSAEIRAVLKTAASEDLQRRLLELNCSVETFLSTPFTTVHFKNNTPQGSLLYMATWFGVIDEPLLNMYIDLDIEHRWLRPNSLACHVEEQDFIQTYQALCPMFIDANIDKALIIKLLEEKTALENRLLLGVNYNSPAYSSMREQLYTASSLACLLDDIELLIKYQLEATEKYSSCKRADKKYFMYLNYLTPLKLACEKNDARFVKLVIANLNHVIVTLDMKSNDFENIIEDCIGLLINRGGFDNELEMLNALRSTFHQEEALNHQEDEDFLHRLYHTIMAH